MTCTRCGKVAPTDTLFYASRSPKYEYFGRIPICKDCVNDIYTEIFEKTQDRKTSIINALKLNSSLLQIDSLQKNFATMHNL